MCPAGQHSLDELGLLTVNVCWKPLSGLDAHNLTLVLIGVPDLA